MNSLSNESGSVKLVEIECLNQAESGKKHSANLAQPSVLNLHLQLSKTMARKFAKPGVEQDDLIQEGYLAILKASGNFKKGFKPNQIRAYTAKYVKGAALKYVREQCYPVQLPVSENTKIEKAAEQFRQVTGREPSSMELANQAGISVDKVVEEQVRKLSFVSLDAPVGCDAELNLHEVLPDERSQSEPAIQSESRELIDILTKALATLDERAARVVQMRYGFGYCPCDSSCHGHTTKEVAKLLAARKEEIEELERKALRRLRSNLSGLLAELRD